MPSDEAEEEEEEVSPPQPICGDLSQKLLKEYSKGELLQQGAFGSVYAFTHRTTQEEVAVKLIDKAETPVEAIAREVDMMKALSHCNVVRCRQAFSDGGFTCIVMDKFAGDLLQGLQDQLAEHGRNIAGHKAVHLCAQAAAAVEHLHRQCILHRDVKLDNFLVDRDDILDPKCWIVLTDFGAAVTLRSPDDRLRVDCCGTLTYWAPERHGSSTYGLKADVWSLGVTMYSLLTGTLPFSKSEHTPVQTPRSFRLSQRRLDVKCYELLMGMLEKDEKARFNSKEVVSHRWLSSWMCGSDEGCAWVAG